MMKPTSTLALICVLAASVTFCAALSITQSEINTLLSMHNTARARMGAQTMPDLTWDSNLATVASNWAAGCTNTHNDDRTTQYDNLAGSTDYVGENIANAYDSQGYPTITTTAQFWFDEEQYWSYPNTCTGSTCGHWTQIIWANTLRVGCDYVTCPPPRSGVYAKYLVCNYAPGGNYNNENPYVRASPVASTTPTTTSTPPTSTTTPTSTTIPPTTTSTPVDSSVPTDTSTPVDSSVPTDTSTPSAGSTPTDDGSVPNSAAQLQFAILSCLAAMMVLML